MDRQEPPDALVIDSRGQLRHHGVVLTSVLLFLNRLDRRPGDMERLMRGRALPATDVFRISTELRTAVAERIIISTK